MNLLLSKQYQNNIKRHSSNKMSFLGFLFLPLKLFIIQIARLDCMEAGRKALSVYTKTLNTQFKCTTAYAFHRLVVCFNFSIIADGCCKLIASCIDV